jgi:hypothetical protein
MDFDPDVKHEPYKSAHPCDHCGTDEEPTHAVQTGDGFLIVCEICRAEVVGGS